jgi:DNA-binding MarR family transcriptional regulator
MTVVGTTHGRGLKQVVRQTRIDGILAGDSVRLGAQSVADGGATLPAIWDLFGNDALVPRLLLLAKMIERQTSRHLQQEFNMSVAQWRVLAFVCISGPATAAFIGHSAEVDQAEISRAVRALAERGLVTREFEKGSRKRLAIAATPSGMENFGQIRRRRHHYFSRITAALGAKDAAQLDRSLRQIAEDVVTDRNSSDGRR